MMNKKTVLLLSTAALLAAGCNDGKKDSLEGDDSETKQPDPVTIRVGVPQQWLTDDEFNRYVVEPVKKKYPWINVVREAYGTGRSLSELVAAGETPDLIAQSNTAGMPDLRNLNLFYPLTEYIAKYKLDLNQFEPEALEALKAATQMQELAGIPYTRHFYALYYNKDLFDKFGVAYPADGLTWDEVYELAKRLTRVEDGVQYRGLELAPIERPASQLSLPYVDMRTKKTLINSDPWKRVLELGVKVHQIPGNEQITMHGAADSLFTQNKLAMHATINILFEARFEDVPDLNWDMASYPVWPGLPGIGMRINEHIMMLASTSKHKEEAFLVAATMASEEVQMSLSRHARFSILNNQKIRDSFGLDIPFLKGKNVQAIYKTKPAKSFVPTEYDSLAMSAMNTALNDVIVNGKDINTVLREAEEKVNKQIEEAEVAKGLK
jgi:multiple sugar transport system substrate-binding protein